MFCRIIRSITSGSMLGVATFAVGSMLADYSSASNSATPRSFPLIIADDVSQNALSSFIGAFIFGIVAYVALENGYYGPAGRFGSYSTFGEAGQYHWESRDRAFRSLASLDYPNIKEVSKAHAQFAFSYAKKTLTLDKEIELLKQAVQFNDTNWSIRNLTVGIY